MLLNVAKACVYYGDFLKIKKEMQQKQAKCCISFHYIFVKIILTDS